MSIDEEIKIKQNAQEYYEKGLSYNQVYRQGVIDGYAKAIDEFEIEIRDWQGDIRDNEHDADKYDFVFERIYEIAEEMRGVT